MPGPRRVLNTILAVTLSWQGWGAGVSELELPRARSWGLGKREAGTAAWSMPYLTFPGASSCVLEEDGSE